MAMGEGHDRTTGAHSLDLGDEGIAPSRDLQNALAARTARFEEVPLWVPFHDL